MPYSYTRSLSKKQSEDPFAFSIFLPDLLLLPLLRHSPPTHLLPPLTQKPGAAAKYDFEDPAFFPMKMFTWHKELEAKSGIILEELEQFLKDTPVNFAPYFRPDLVNRPGVWQTLGLRLWGMDNSDIINYFPRTMEVLKCVPRMVSLSFNHLQANGEVRYHQGNTNGIARFHLGLRVPEGDAFFEVNGERRKWEEGKLLAFTDAHWHTAGNYTEKSRYIMLFDVVHDRFKEQEHYLCARVAGDLCTQYYVGRSKFLASLKGFWRGLARFLIYTTLVPYFHFKLRTNPDILGRFS